MSDLDTGVEFNADYFLRGQETGVSLYKDYRWLPELTLPMAHAISKYLKLDRDASIMDFGCARGYLVKALRQLGYNAYGYDVSEWAVKNCDPDVIKHVSNKLTGVTVDWIIAKDVLEHVATEELDSVLKCFSWKANKGVFIVVPLSLDHGSEYVVPEYEKDVTHKIRMTLPEWNKYVARMLGTAFEIESTYRVPGVKDNYYDTFPLGNGFITARRI